MTPPLTENERFHRQAGAWEAFNQVLAWINTQEARSIPKNELYAAVMEMRPANEYAT